MLTVFDENELPDDFEGQCIVVESENLRILSWYVKGKILHREDGPAQILPDGTNYYYIFGESFLEKNYWKHPLVTEYKLNKILEL